ncbi:MAG TPA: bifunctional rhamnulose-1-phosphate aldolase/short-chain dehydrogenase [Chthonomonadaceae bacterium]|nr:bifunctional rhamnulose-1-phosphate aldolase/short-chain dehydrogenase [Chthonomonadaceae bacterium]
MQSRWNEAEAGALSPLEQLIAMSRWIGAETDLVVWGGGNTSLKVWETDFRGRETYVLRIKGSGSDLKTIERKHFSGVRMEDVLPLQARDEMSDEEMVAYLAHALLSPTDPRPSIETLLHAFLPAAAVAHSHADAIVALSNNTCGPEAVREALGAKVIQIPYRRPGFLLSKEVGAAVQAMPDAEGLVLMNHGLITWGDTCRAAYESHIALTTRAETYLAAKRKGKRVFGGVQVAALPEERRREVAAAVAPVLRGAICMAPHPQPLPPRTGGGEQPALRMVLRYEDSDAVLDFVGSEKAARVSQIGAATPDHILSTKVLPLFVPVTQPDDPEHVARWFREAAAKWREDYTAYYHRHRVDEPMLDPIPRVILVPGLGMWTAGKDSKTALVPADIYRHTIRILGDAEGVSAYRSLHEADAFSAEYWGLELYKLTLAPPEKELARRIALVTGAASGIGKAIAERFAAEGAHVVIADLNAQACQSVADALNRQHGGRCALGLAMDVTDEAAVKRAFAEIARTYGGLDILVSNAGIAPTGRIENLSLETWERSFAVNATGHFLVAREAVKMMRAQGLGGSLVFNVTKNVPAPGADFGAYSCAKAAEAQLARILAVENGAYGIRCNLLNPDAVFEAGLWTPELKAERARAKGIPIEQFEESIRQGNLLKTAVFAEDVAQAALFFASDRSARTTGAMLPIDGGLREAFPR